MLPGRRLRHRWVVVFCGGVVFGVWVLGVDSYA